MKITFRAAMLHEAIHAVREFSSTDDSRPHLLGIHVRMRGTDVNFVATDGCGLAVYATEVEQEDGLHGEEEEQQFTFSNRAVSQLVEDLRRVKDLRGHLQVDVEFDLKSEEYRIPGYGTMSLVLVKDTKFPPLKNVFQEKLPKKRVGIFPIQPKYMRKIANAFESIGAGSTRTIRMEPLGEYDSPICCTDPEFKALTVLVMGVRLDEKAYKLRSTARPRNLLLA